MTVCLILLLGGVLSLFKHVLSFLPHDYSNRQKMVLAGSRIMDLKKKKKKKKFFLKKKKKPTRRILGEVQMLDDALHYEAEKSIN